MTRNITRLARLRLNVADLGRSCGFYADGLGFERTSEDPGRALLRLGAQEIVLVQAPPDAEPYPSPRAANDPWFQHFAVAVSDMAAAYARLEPHLRDPISRGGPQRLPPSTGSVTAFKFRDPDGHPLELSYAPGSPWAKAAASGGPLFQGIDHTALAVSDLETSVAFYEALGLRVAPRLLNRGPEQDRLDGLDDVAVDIAVLLTPEPGPHLELLHYRSPPRPPARVFGAGDLAATTTVWGSARPLAGAGPELDPGGHRLTFEPG